MTENARNIVIGMTVLVALALLGGMILIFAGLPGPFQTGYRIRMRFSSTGNAQEGDTVHLNGLPVGKITEIHFADGDPRKGVTMIARINRGVSIPANVRAYISGKGLAGGAFVDLKPEGPDRVDPKTGKPMDLQPLDLVPGEIKSGIQVSDELDKTLTAVARLADNLNDLVGSRKDLRGQPDAPPSVFTAVASLNRILAGLERVFGNVKTEKGIEEIIANLSDASASAVKAMDNMAAFAKEARATAEEATKTFQGATTMIAGTKEHIDRLAAKLVDDAEKISILLSTINKAAMQMSSGEGSAGRFLNDPKLYNSLLETTRQLGELLKEFQELVKLWKDRGVGIKLK